MSTTDLVKQSTPPNDEVLDDRLPTESMDEMPDRLFLLTYGLSGVGKTVLAGSAALDPRLAPVLFVDVEGGMRSISHIRGLRRYRITDYAPDVNRLMSYLRTAIAENNLPYRTLVIDSCTALGEKAMEAVLAIPAKRAIANNPEYSDWNTWTNRVRNFYYALRDLYMDPNGINIIVTALEEEHGGMRQPLFKGQKFAPELPGIFDLVGRQYVVSTRDADQQLRHEYRLMLRGDSRYVTKDRSAPAGMLPDEVVAPTAAKLLDRVLEGKRIQL